MKTNAQRYADTVDPALIPSTLDNLGVPSTTTWTFPDGSQISVTHQPDVLAVLDSKL